MGRQSDTFKIEHWIVTSSESKSEKGLYTQVTVGSHIGI